MRYINTLTEKPFVSVNKTDLAYELYQSSWLKNEYTDIYHWCKGASFRLYQVHNIVLDYDEKDLESFIDALIQYNIIREVH